jgi:hypothetical protein
MPETTCPQAVLWIYKVALNAKVWRWQNGAEGFCWPISKEIRIADEETMRHVLAFAVGAFCS